MLWLVCVKDHIDKFNKANRSFSHSNQWRVLLPIHINFTHFNGNNKLETQAELSLYYDTLQCNGDVTEAFWKDSSGCKYQNNNFSIWTQRERATLKYSVFREIW